MATNGAAPDHQGGNAYNLFILVLTVVSLLIMVLMWLPFSPETIALLRVYDNVICVIFLIDFALSLRRARSKRGPTSSRSVAGSICSAPCRRCAVLKRLASCDWHG